MPDRPGFDVLSAEFWKNLPAIMSAAAGNPLGVIALLLILVSLLGLAFFRHEEWRVKGGLLVLLLLAGTLAVYVGSHAADVKPAPAVAIAGRVTAEDGIPVKGATVSIITDGVPPQTATDSEGNYSFAGVMVRSGSDAKLTVRAPGYEYYERLMRADTTGRFQDIRLTRQRVIADQAPPPPPKPPNPPRKPSVIELRGRVLDPSGNPVERAEVIVETDGNPPRTDRQHTDSDGYYRITGYEIRPNAAVRLLVRAAGFRPLQRNISPDTRGRIEEVQLTLK